ncbi:acyl-CoA reductase [Neolewinella aurantiaca]|uniref:Acyl-CoA reductase n=2 Tax=Neolewinella aurantiaca TaxID=2602767 RepID=A0A5C7FQA5_9BACT|nr:acyl-CoA reductase [Neolewinella aurantiaca]
MTLQERLSTLHQLAAHLTGPEDEFLTALQKRTLFNNAWFTLENQQASVKAIAEEFLSEEKLNNWLNGYKIIPIAGEGFVPQPGPNGEGSKTVGLVLAGNIPLVGFHDILCVYVAGHKAQIKLSSKDEYVLPYLIKLLAQSDERATGYFDIVDNLGGYDAVIATGSNNSARYFETYFAKVPHIIRKNRNAVAVLSGEETEEQMRALGNDVFQYFGLGCRNVSKLYVPEGYDFDPLLHVFHEWKNLQNHTKWKNNFDYNYALTTLNKESFHLTGPLMVLEAEAIPSRIGTLHFEYYPDVAALVTKLEEQRDEIQLVVTFPDFLNVDLPVFSYGQAQQPALADYADGVDTLAFLLGLLA